MQKIAPILADYASTALTILFGAGLYKTLSTLTPKLIELWQNRKKPKAEEALILAQREKVLAEAGEVRARSDIPLIQVILSMAEARQVEIEALREKVAAFERERRRSGNGRG